MQTAPKGKSIIDRICLKNTAHSTIWFCFGRYSTCTWCFWLFIWKAILAFTNEHSIQSSGRRIEALPIQLGKESKKRLALHARNQSCCLAGHAFSVRVSVETNSLIKVYRSCPLIVFANRWWWWWWVWEAQWRKRGSGWKVPIWTLHLLELYWQHRWFRWSVPYVCAMPAEGSGCRGYVVGKSPITGRGDAPDFTEAAQDPAKPRVKSRQRNLYFFVVQCMFRSLQASSDVMWWSYITCIVTKLGNKLPPMLFCTFGACTLCLRWDTQDAYSIQSKGWIMISSHLLKRGNCASLIPRREWTRRLENCFAAQ